MRWNPEDLKPGGIARTALIMVALLATGCADDRPEKAKADSGVVGSAEPLFPAAAEGAAPKWSLQPGNTMLEFARGATTVLRLSCTSRSGLMALDVPAFRAIRSEERLSLGSGNAALALVADTRGEGVNSGVTGTGGAPEDLGQVLSGRVSASYGAQTSGPHPAPPANLVRAFVGACAPATASSEPVEVAAGVSPCLVQDGELLQTNALRAVGTEPFWAARIDGRCVTYSHPDDQAGTRVWTSFGASGEGGSWSGVLGGKPFVLRSRTADCSDGMSDRRYPLEVTLAVGGEERRGCAAPL